MMRCSRDLLAAVPASFSTYLRHSARTAEDKAGFNGFPAHRPPEWLTGRSNTPLRKRIPDARA